MCIRDSQRGDAVFEDVSVGHLVASKGGAEIAPEVGSCGLLTGGDGDHDREVLGTDGGASPALCEGNDTGDGSRICRLSMVPATGSERRAVCDKTQEGRPL